MKRSLALVLFLAFNLSISYSQSKKERKYLVLKETIIKESKDGGKYDYFTPIKGHEYEGVQIKPGVYDTKRGHALIKWGELNFKLGVKTLEEVYILYAEVKGKDLNTIEKDYIRMGYNQELK